MSKTVLQTLTFFVSTVLCPVMGAKALYYLLSSWFGLSPGLSLLLGGSFGYWIYQLNQETELYYFRELLEEREAARRTKRFLLGLPLIYLASALGGVLTIFLFRLFQLSTSFGYLVALGLCYGVYHLGLFQLNVDDHHRGRRIYSHRYQMARAVKSLPPGDPGILIGDIPIATKAFQDKGSVCYVGMVGSGKTTCIKHVMATALPTIGKGGGRAAIYDSKLENLNLISCMTSCPVYTYHPFDKRCVGWKMWDDIRSPAQARQLSRTLVPKTEGPNAYFDNAARAILRGIIEVFVKTCPDSWDLRDVINATESKEMMKQIFMKTKATRRLVTKYLDIKEYQSVASSLETHFEPFAPIAAAWSRADEQKSIREWVAGEFIIVLGNDESAKAPLMALNQVLFQQITEQVLVNETQSPVWIFLDEVRDIGKNLEGLSSLLTRGRSFNVRNVLGFQAKTGMDDAFTYNRACEIIGQCAYLGLLRVIDPETKEYLARIVGERERRRISTTTAQDGTKSTSEQLVKEQAVLPDEFSELGLNHPEPGVEGFFYTEFGVHKTVVPFPEKAEGKVPGFEPRDIKDQDLEPWTDEDLFRLGLTQVEDLATEQGSTRPQEQEPNGPGQAKELKQRTFRFTKGATALSVQPQQEQQREQ